jgi:hypothetical protein
MTGRHDPAPAQEAELADLIAAAVASCPGVAGLTQIPGVPVATYLPGRTVSGVAVRAGEVEVCAVARYGLPLPQIAAQIRQAVVPLVPGRVVHVLIGDITLPGAEKEPVGRPQPATAPAAPAAALKRQRRGRASGARQRGESANG